MANIAVSLTNIVTVERGTGSFHGTICVIVQVVMSNLSWHDDCNVRSPFILCLRGDARVTFGCLVPIVVSLSAVGSKRKIRATKALMRLTRTIHFIEYCYQFPLSTHMP
jgi:hypothetical protein